ncbi:hypothetical protein ACH5RR_023695 [Cinchona calisaya]|uniref:RING-type E3 ubiquitin transferase n=1 Tax=Cinchona calisaya TaxID=153742 RepID=A0ABD2ZBG1_9GENT
MSFLYPPPPPPPPPITTAAGGSSSNTIVITQPQYANTNNADVMNDTSSSPSPSTSIIIVIIVIASAIIVSASIYLLLRFLSRRCRRTFSSASAADDVVVLPNRRISVSGCLDDQRVVDSSVFDSLPLFTFGSVTGKLAGGDCSVCLSKFEPQDQLRLLPLCCHAFHARCIDTWLSSNLTCPLCRSTVNASDSDVLNKILSSTDEDTRSNNANTIGNNNVNRSGSFRVEIGSVSRRRGTSDSGDGRRSYSIGSFDYIVDDGYEVPVGSMHQRGVSDCTSTDKESVGIPMTGPPGESLAAEVSSGRSWLRDYVDRLSSFSFSSRSMSFRSSGRYIFGSSRRNGVVVPVADLEANPIGEEISEYFRWLSGV